MRQTLFTDILIYLWISFPASLNRELATEKWSSSGLDLNACLGATHHCGSYAYALLPLK